ncbi:MAG TPA: sensor histidine kinase [Aliidongia sp.]|uniref:sensor histidine kinase n=1 Tax=Aliidongia sp. TaxID=1914230 RepID=UPI002DDCDEA3|nr:sensor histidine kinase [Aliidongia sp.]HEV2674921.1 sensor histidine kinase [Aliidongia sp.]
MVDRLSRRDRHLRYACLLLIATIGARAAYAGVFEQAMLAQYENVPRWTVEWSAGYVCFVAAYLLAARDGVGRLRPAQGCLLAVQSLSALFLVWLYPSFIVACLLVVVCWQIAWSASLRVALVAALLQSAALAAMNCTGESNYISLFVLFTNGGFELFAISAAALARREAIAHDELARVNAELKAAQALMTESARMAERLRISRDLHDILGHSLTTLTIHLDVASRLAEGPAVEHVACARGVARALLAEVRAIVNRVRVEPIDLKAALQALTEGAIGLGVRLILPEDLSALDPARADAVLRCVQEIVTNTLRHAHAHELVIELEQMIDGTVAISARDDGQGGQCVEGRGLAGMRERFEMLGGTLSIASRQGQGFSIRGAIPAAGAFS